MDTSLTLSVFWSYLWEAVQKGQGKESFQMLHEARCYLGRVVTGVMPKYHVALLQQQQPQVGVQMPE